MKYSFLLAGFLVFLCTLEVSAQDVPQAATVKQIREAVDWAKLPRLEGASKVQTQFNHMSYQAPGTFQQASDFYQKQLAALGWQADKSLPTGDQKEYLSLMVEKAGMRMSVSGYRSNPAEPMTITLMILGNVDVSLFPKVADAEVKTNNKNAVYYFSKLSTDEITSFCKKFMTERGWKEVPNDAAAMWAKEGRFVLTFHQNAIECTIVAAKKTGHVEVTYSSMVRHQLDAQDVTTTISGKDQSKPASLKEAMDVINIMKLPRMEKAVKGKFHKELRVLPIGTSYDVPDSLDDAVTFYRKLLKDQGWTELSPDVEMDNLSKLKFEKAGFLLILSVSHDKKEANTSVSLLNCGNVDLRKLPYPPGAKLPTNRGEFINMETSLSVDEAFEFYRKELSNLGWKEVKQLGKGTMRFTQNDVELRLEIGQNIYKKTAIQLRTGMR